MNTQNGFNICPKCGSANGFNAKFCYQCGQRLQVPEEPATCPHCHSVNSGLANFCKSCGAPLKKQNKTKLCPKCHKQVPSTDGVCSCGYVFEGKKSRGGKAAPQKLKGRALAIVSLILLLAFVYFAFVPTTIGSTTVRFGFMTRDNGIVRRDTGTNKYAYDLVARMVKDVSDGGIEAWLGQGAFWIIVTALATAFSLSAAVHFLCALIRTFTNKRKGKVNWFYFAMFVITAVAVLLVELPSLTGKFDLFANGHYSVGYELLLVPAYYFVFFVISLLTRRKKNKND